MANFIGKNLIVIGLIIAIVGVLLYFRDSICILKYFGRLPGDIVIKKEKFGFYFPLATSIVVSIILSLIFILFNKLR